MTEEPKIKLELYLRKLSEQGVDVQEAKRYLEGIISSNASKQPREVR